MVVVVVVLIVVVVYLSHAPISKKLVMSSVFFCIIAVYDMVARALAPHSLVSYPYCPISSRVMTSTTLTLLISLSASKLTVRCMSRCSIDADDADDDDDDDDAAAADDDDI